MASKGTKQLLSKPSKKTEQSTRKRRMQLDLDLAHNSDDNDDMDSQTQSIRNNIDATNRMN
jgi:hypothetical protein